MASSQPASSSWSRSVEMYCSYRSVATVGRLCEYACALSADQMLGLLDTRWFHRLPEGVTVVNDWQELVISLLEMCVLWDPFGRGRRSTTLRPGYTATLEATQPLVVFSANYVSPWRLPNRVRTPLLPGWWRWRLHRVPSLVLCLPELLHGQLCILKPLLFCFVFL